MRNLLALERLLFLIQLDIIKHICRIIARIPASSTTHHVLRRHALVFTYSALLISTECIASQVAILGIQTLLSLVGFLCV